MARERVEKNIQIEDARIGLRNFSGKESQYNPAGKRNFCVFLDNAFASGLEREGWNIRWSEPKEEGDEPRGYLQVAVSFDNIPPKIVMISSKGHQVLTSETVSLLDWVEIEVVDLIIRPYNWVMHEGKANEMSGVKAYLKDMYIKIVEDDLAKKWSVSQDEDDVPF